MELLSLSGYTTISRKTYLHAFPGSFPSFVIIKYNLQQICKTLEQMSIIECMRMKNMFQVVLHICIIWNDISSFSTLVIHFHHFLCSLTESWRSTHASWHQISIKWVSFQWFAGTTNYVFYLLYLIVVRKLTNVYLFCLHTSLTKHQIKPSKRY